MSACMFKSSFISWNSIFSSICEIPAAPPLSFTLPSHLPWLPLLHLSAAVKLLFVCVCVCVCKRAPCVCVCLQSGWSPAVGAVNHIAGRWDQDVQRTHSTYLALCRYERCKQGCVCVCVPVCGHARVCVCVAILAVCERMRRLQGWRCVCVCVCVWRVAGIGEYMSILGAVIQINQVWDLEVKLRWAQ